MSPAHGAKKHNRRYRYYVSQAVLQFREEAAGSVARLPAVTIEDLVIGRITRLLGDAHALLQLAQPLRLDAD